jgi:hypothetical protein
LGRKAKEVDSDLIGEIEDAVAEGAKTNKQISEAIGWKEGTFKQFRYPNKKRPAYLEYNQPIEDAIKRGFRRRRNIIRRAATDSLLKLVTGYEVEDRTVQKVTKDGVKTETQKITKKSFGPSVTAVIFALVNTDENYKSINKVIPETEENRGLIRSWIEQQKEGIPKND